jgi:hypothetical protein
MWVVLTVVLMIYHMKKNIFKAELLEVAYENLPQKNITRRKK